MRDRTAIISTRRQAPLLMRLRPLELGAELTLCISPCCIIVGLITPHSQLIELISNDLPVVALPVLENTNDLLVNAGAATHFFAQRKSLQLFQRLVVVRP